MQNTEHITLHNINCLYLKPENDKKNITIFMYHGWGSSVENQLFLATILAKWGYHVIIPEIIYHDSRDCLEEHFNQTIQEQYFWKTILKTASEVSSLINNAFDKGYTANHKIIILGSSMGGFIATGAFVMTESIDALININGSGSWVISEYEFQKSGSYPSLLMEEIQKNDPILYLEGLKERPILLLHGSHDSSIHPKGQQHFFEKVSKKYKDPTIISLKIFPNVNHSITLSMIETVIDWIDENLK